MVLVESCVTSVGEALRSVEAGVHRLELCRDLRVGGLTPSPRRVAEVVAAVDVPVFALVRPRAGDFRARPGEVDAMAAAIRTLAEAGAAGVVVGVLDARERVDRPALDALMATAGALPVTFHRAFDRVSDGPAGLDALADAGVARVLTAGGPGTAWENRRRLAGLVEAAAGRVVVLAGGGVRGPHARTLVEATRVGEVHARAAAVAGVTRALLPGDSPTSGAAPPRFRR